MVTRLGNRFANWAPYETPMQFFYYHVESLVIGKPLKPSLIFGSKDWADPGGVTYGVASLNCKVKTSFKKLFQFQPIYEAEEKGPTTATCKEHPSLHPALSELLPKHSKKLRAASVYPKRLQDLRHSYRPKLQVIEAMV